MMNLLEEAIIYATVLHQGKVRKINNIPFILHPLEVAQILSTMTGDIEVLTAGVLHDVVEDTDGTLPQIEKRFGRRVADLVDSETENKYPGEDKALTWKRRKAESLLRLKNSTDIGVKMLWLADKLANIRSIAGTYSEKGEAVWEAFHQKDPELHRWYYKSVAEYVEFDLNRTGAYKEFIKHINFIWPETFASEKTRYKKYKEVSVEGCRMIGQGAKGNVYRYNDELIIKVYHEGNTYRDVEREMEISRKAFVLGLPTAISFGIVAVGKGYGAMSELIDSPSISQRIAMNPGETKYYAKVMAELARQIHETEADGDIFPDAKERLRERVELGIACEDAELGKQVMHLIEALPDTKKLTHGDLHTGNVLLMNGKPILIDLDRLSYGHPIVDLSTVYLSYVAFGENDPKIVEDFMGFSYETSQRFYRYFMSFYLDTEDEARIREVTDKAALLCYVRLISRIRKKGDLTEEDRAKISILVEKIRDLLQRVESLEI